MGMNIHIRGLRDNTDEKRIKMMDAVFALKTAGVEKLPKELQEYFGETFVGDVDETTGLNLDLVIDGEMYSERGCRIDVKQLPEGIRWINVFYS